MVFLTGTAFHAGLGQKNDLQLDRRSVDHVEHVLDTRFDGDHSASAVSEKLFAAARIPSSAAVARRA